MKYIILCIIRRTNLDYRWKTVRKGMLVEMIFELKLKAKYRLAGQTLKGTEFPQKICKVPET